jgi:hypothetical protein
MQPRTGSWSFDDHTTSTWVPAEIGIPSPSSGPSTHPEPERDESAIWDDPDEATRKLSSHDLARTLDSATDLEMDWDEDESTTNAYNPSHARVLLQAAPQAQAPQPTAASTRSAARPQSAVRQRAVRPEDMYVEAEPADPATAGALESLKPLTNPPAARPRNARATPANTANTTKLRSTSPVAPRTIQRPTLRPQTQPPVLRAAPARPVPVLKPAPTLKPVPASAASAKPTPTLKPVPARRMATGSFEPVAAPQAAPPRRMATGSFEPVAAPQAAPPRRMATGSFEPVATPQAAPPRLVPRSPTLQQAPVPVPAASRPASAPPGMIPPPPPPQPATGNERAWTQAWEDAQALARTNLPGYVQPQQHLVAAPPQAQHVRRVAHQRVDGPTYRNFPPPAAHEAYGEAEILPPAAAMPELGAVHATYEVDDFELEQPAAQSEIKRLALRSVIPGLALFGAVLMGRVLLSGPAPAPTPAPTAEVAPAQTAPAITPEPAPVEPAPTAAAPAANERRSKSTRSRSRATQADSSDIAASAPRATRTREVFDTEPATRSTKSEKAETADDAAPAAAAATSGIGILRLNSRPWSQVFVDGKLVGNTPQMGLRLRAGKHQIELVNPQLGMSKKFQVTVAADEIVTRAEMLEE